MNAFDGTIIHAFNALAQRSPVFDHVVAYFEDAHLFKGGVIVALFWGLWLEPGPARDARRRTLLATLAGCALAIVAARVLAVLLPFRNRPLHESEIEFTIPLGFDDRQLWGWSSFPSDHAALFFGLAAGIYLISKRLGWVAFVHGIIIVTFPRIYLGIHYPTDLLAGAALGIACVWATNRRVAVEWIGGTCLRWEARAPFLFNFCFYLVAFEVAVLFDDVRSFAHLGSSVAKFLLHGVEFPDS